MTQRHINQGQMFDEFNQAEPIKAAPVPEGFVHCSPCHGSGVLYDPPRCCNHCSGTGHRLADEQP